MNDVGELKEFATVHARAQNIRRYRDVLDRIDSDEDGGPGSWAGEWSRAAEEFAARPLEACRRYNMARFPYVDGPARLQALRRCVESFDEWRQGQKDVTRLDLDLEGGRVGAWATGLSSPEPRPLVLIMGGIVSVKEQWAPVLDAIRGLGMAAVVTEMPGVGENTLRYTPESRRMLSGLLDALEGRADVSRTYAMALSFGGHMAMRCAVEDRRIRGIVTTGAPVRAFFTDAAWQRQVPDVTMDTLAHLTGTKRADLPDRLAAWALTDDQLAALDIPVHYAASRRDEIIPAEDVDLLRRKVPGLSVLEHDDVHGSPHHVTETRLWSAWSVLRMADTMPVQRALAGGLLRLFRMFR
ncbi:alpha/beta hydrolase [Actinomadura sp. DC4]|uniref:alpha/beta hydrolase n=1 Tax=Actinomadura sp. DC4 TaxID=3055069 RepID=UPI0025AFDF97|nr:alpha/beta hydrolase [Actinomadura sp. DC4]MDN3359005.1 alpha/beta hydrolase [Actinomadura sp. DC4]